MERTTLTVRCAAMLAALAISAICTSARASETPIYGGPIGGTDIGGAYLPPAPGLYLGGGGLGATSNRYNDRNGKTPDVDTEFDALAGLVGAVYVYPGTVLGGTVATSAQLGFGQRCLRFGERSCNTGLTDIYSDVFFWSRHVGLAGARPGLNPKHLAYGLVIGAGLGLTVPTGAYSKTRTANTGSNIFIVSPNVAVTYLTGKNFLGGDGTEISGRFFFSMPQHNHATGFDAGPVVDLDWAITQHYGNWQVGVAGQQAKQVGDDRLPDGQRTGTLKFSQGSIGPVVSVFVPKIKSFVKLKAIIPYDARNTFTSTGIVFVVSRKL